MKPSGPLKRSALKRSRRRSRTAAEAAAAKAWHEAIVGSPCDPLVSETESSSPYAPSIACGHHIIPQQVLRRRAAELDVDPALLLWDVRVGMKVSVRRHERHHSGHEPIPRDRIPVRVFGFADEWGLRPYLDRHYPYESDPGERV